MQINSALFNIAFMNDDSKHDDSLLDLDMQVCFALYSAQLAMNKVYRKLLKALGLTYPQYLVMMVLWEQDAQSVSEIGQRLYLDSATLTPLLKRLETAELVKRARSRADERQVEICLTSQGKALRKSAQSVPEAILCSTQCEPEHLRQLRDDLHALRGRLADSDLAV